MKLKNSLTTNLIVVISGFFIIATYAQKVTWGGLSLQDQLLLVGKAPLTDGSFIGVDAGQWWRIFTVVLTHASWLHLGMNMLVLFQLGIIVERFYGKSRYAFILLASTIFASGVSLLLDAQDQLSVGASGMIFGLFGAMVVAGKKMPVQYGQVLGYLALNLVIGFTVPNVDWHAHIGGLLGGALAALLLRTITPRQRTY
jgi:membrane associated rhomboid family serine protease